MIINTGRIPRRPPPDHRPLWRFWVGRPGVRFNAMKTLLRFLGAPVLALLMGQAPSLAQLRLVIDQDTGRMDWLEGSSITMAPGIANNWFGLPLTPDATITSPLPSYTGDGSHIGVVFDLSGDRTRIDGIILQTDLPPGGGAVFAGTAEGPAVPVFSTGDFSLFSHLNLGEYTLPAFGPWSGGIQVSVVPESAPWWCLPAGLAAVLRWRRRG